MRPAALARPDLLGARQVPVLVGGLLYLRPDFHGVLAARLHQRLRAEQPQICGRAKTVNGGDAGEPQSTPAPQIVGEICCELACSTLQESALVPSTPLGKVNVCEQIGFLSSQIDFLRNDKDRRPFSKSGARGKGWGDDLFLIGHSEDLAFFALYFNLFSQMWLDTDEICLWDRSTPKYLQNNRT